MKYLVLIFFSLSVFLPGVVDAQLVPCGTDGVACTECHLVEMGNTIIVWLIGIMFIIFGFVAVAAGWGLVTAGGNPGALSDAKSMFTNAFIGLIIVLAAWLIVDTFMRQLLNNGDLTQYEGFGLWSEIDCGSMAQTFSNPTEFAGDLVTSAAVSCDVGPSGARVLCGAQIAACSGTATTDTSDPSNHQVVCETQVGIEDPGTTREVCDAGPSGDQVLCSRLESECTVSGGTPTVDTSNSAAYTVACSPAAPTAACQTGSMSSMSLFGFNTTVDNGMRSRLEAVNSDWQSRGGNSFYRVYSVGAYNCRTISNSSRYSVHAYGLAVDINPRDNGYVKTTARPCPTDMPSAFVNIFKSRGFGWGGDWRSVCDAMHFSADSGEGGWINVR